MLQPVSVLVFTGCVSGSRYLTLPDTEISHFGNSPWKVLSFPSNMSLLNVFQDGTICSENPCNVLYIDGPRSGSGTSCAFVTANRDSMFRIPNEASVYTAELTAIYRAVRIV